MTMQHSNSSPSLVLENNDNSSSTAPSQISVEEYDNLKQQVAELSLEDACFELLECARYGEVDAVLAIIQHHPSCVFEALDESQSTALHKACANGHVSTVRLLLQNDAPLIANNSGNTPLHWAAANGHHEVVAVLLEHYPNDKIDVLQKNGFGRSALTEGFGSKSTETAKLLLEHDSASEDKLLTGGKPVGKEEQSIPSGEKNAESFVIHDFCFGSKEYNKSIVKIQELPITTDDPFGESAIDDTTGFGIWSASLVMAQWMAHLSLSKKVFEDKLVIELGAGCGVPGLTIAQLSTPEQVYVTDLNPTTVQNLETNILLNNLQDKVTATKMDWEDKKTWPVLQDETIANERSNIVVVGSDLIYQESIAPLLKQVILSLLCNGGTFYYVAPDTGRAGLDQFLMDIQQEVKLVSKTVAPSSYQSNPLNSQDEEEFFMHFHELTSSTYILYEFKKE